MSTIQPPLLVTGAHRSGSTWVGRILATSSGLRYVDEPFNIEVHGERSTLTRWFTYVTPALEYRYKDFVRFFNRACYLGPPDERPLVKDPIAFFSAEWIAEKYNADVVVLVRHPAAFASSLKRLNWTFDFNHLLEQTELMNEKLSGFADAIEAYAKNPPDIIAQASLLWSIIYSTAATYRQAHPIWRFLRHEDLCAEPLRYYGKLFHTLGLEMTDDVKQAIVSTSNSRNPANAPQNSVHHLYRDSKSVTCAWRRSLSSEEIERIRDMTDKTAAIFYSDEDWFPDG